MKKANQILLTVIAMVVIMIAAVGIDKGIRHYEDERKREERMEQYRQAYAQASELQMEISELSKDKTAIEAFIEENSIYFEDEDGLGNQTFFQEGSLSGNSVSENSLFGNDILEGDVSGNDVSGNDVSGNMISEDEIWDGSVSDNTVSGNDISGNSISDNDISDDALWDDSREDSRQETAGAAPGPYMRTIYANESDLRVIADNRIDFSQMTIACLGDSITEASNLDDMEDYQQYSYPQQLKEILGAKNVVNLGIGGSSIGRYWDQAFVDRYQEIPEDTDIIIVMGGTNDGFCLSQQELGDFEQRERGTFIGDLDELMQGLKESYPDAFILFATPPSNILHDMLRRERDDMIPQREIVYIIKQLGEEYDIPVTDLYSSGMLDTHDAAVIYNYMPDGVHGNPAGYRVLAQHMAAEIIRLYDRE